MSTAIPKNPSLVSVRYVVMSILNRLQDYTMKSYKRLCQICIEGFTEEFSLYHIGNSIEVVYLHMSTAKTVALPPDFVDYLKIGVPVEGKLRVITRNDSILLPRVFDDTGEAIGNYYGTAIGTDDSDLSGVVFFSDHFRSGQFVGGLYGLSGGIDDAYYRIDYENRQIVFSGSTPRSEIVLEYIGTSLKPDGSSLIPREVVAPLRAYVLWQMVADDQRVALNEKERRKREFTELTEALRFFKSSFTAEEYKRVIYQSYSQSPKR
jgi:hypothetical protein